MDRKRQALDSSLSSQLRATVLTVAITILMATTTSSQASSEAVDVACDRSVVAQAWDLLKLARYGESNHEHAAFIVRDAAGNRRFVMWPYQQQYHRATWSGSPPNHTIAIIHTHPNANPIPSAGDAQVALRTGLPVYVVTRTMIHRTLVGRGVERIWDGDWNPNRPHAGLRSICSATHVAALNPAR